MTELRDQLQGTLGAAYSLERELGGGMSHVFVATETALGRRVVVKVLLMFALTLVAFRFGERRTFAQLSPFDFAVSVALGAIIGRTFGRGARH